MKSLKKLAMLLFVLMLGASLASAPAVAFADVARDENVASDLSSMKFISDRGNLLSDIDELQLNKTSLDIALDNNIAPYFITVDSLQGYSDADDFAKDFAAAYGLPSKSSNGCVIFLICVPENQFGLYAEGKAASTFSDSTLNHFANELNPYLGRSDWAGAAETYYSDVAQTLEGKTANATSNVAYKGTYVTDNSGVFSDNQRMELEADATALAEQYKMGVYLLVVDYMQDSNGRDLQDPSSTQRTNFATSFYRANGLGLNKNGSSYGDGIMLVVATKSRDYVTIAYGQGSYSFSDEGIKAMEDAVTDELGSDDWYGGAEQYYSRIKEQLAYYDAKGEPWKEPDLLSFILKILATLGIPFGVASGKIKREKAAMVTAREQYQADNYLVDDSLVLTTSTDNFVNTTLMATPIPKHESSSDSDGFGGGGWGGGGGGGFSSSGGGKF